MPTIKVDGMQCAHCKKSVEDAVSALPGVKNARADLEKKELQFDESGQPVDMDKVVKVIRELGFTPKA